MVMCGYFIVDGLQGYVWLLYSRWGPMVMCGYFIVDGAIGLCRATS